MLQNIRKHTEGPLFKVVIGLIVVAFAGWGIQSILLNGGGNEVAVVNGEKISPQELQLAVQNQKRRLFAIYGNNIDPALLDDERLTPQALEALVTRKLLLQSARDMGLTVSERELGAVVANMAQFQVDGAFSPDLYKSLLAQAGYTPASFKASLRDDLVLNQVSVGLAGSEFVTPTELDVNARIMSELRDFSYFTIPRERFSDVPEATDEQIENYYNQHVDDFRTPESVDLQYIELTPTDFFQPVEESALLEAYEAAKQDAQYQPQYRVSHILFAKDGKEDTAERVAAARELLASGKSFADVAREVSDDAGSADKGGDLGYTTGDTFPKAMEEVIAQSEPGVVSGPVETDAGTHLILVTERNAAEPPSFEEMRPELEQGIQTEEARVELLRTVEQLKDLTFNAEDLDGPAKEVGVKVQSANSITRDQSEGLFANPELLAAAYSDEVFNSGLNSDVIELPGEHFVVLRVSKHTPAEMMPIDTVRDSIVLALETAAVDEALVAEADRAVAQLQGGVAIDQYAKDRGYEVVDELAVSRQGTTAPPAVQRRAFELPAPHDDSISADFIATPGGDATVLELERVIPGDYAGLDGNAQQQLRQTLTAENGSLLVQEYQLGLREQAEIDVL